MIVFKTVLKVLNKCKGTILLYTVLLVVFSGVNVQSNTNTLNFVANKPDVAIIDNDNSKLSKDLTKYINDNSVIKDIKEDKIDDAIFYKDVNYVIYIPDNYSEQIQQGKNPEIEIKSAGDYQSSLAEMLLERYSNIINIYSKSIKNDDELISKVNDIISKKGEIKLSKELPPISFDKADRYFSFANYTLMAGAIFVICMVLSSFREEKIKRRTIISSMNYKKYNRYLLISNGVFTLGFWIFYILIGIILIKDAMFTTNGLLFMANSFIFTFCCLTIAFLVNNIINNKNAVNGLINVLALGSSFLCGAFVPTEFLPESVVKIAHILPSYYYINNNSVIKDIQEFNIDTLKPVLINMGIILGFSLVFLIITNIISKHKQRTN